VDDALVVGGLQAPRELRPEAHDLLLGERPWRSSSAGEGPVTSSITRKSRPSAVSKSRSVATCGWLRRERASASFRNRLRAASSRGALGQDLQGHVTVELLVAGAVDLAHAARPSFSRTR